MLKSKYAQLEVCNQLHRAGFRLIEKNGLCSDWITFPLDLMRSRKIKPFCTMEDMVMMSIWIKSTKGSSLKISMAIVPWPVAHGNVK